MIYQYEMHNYILKLLNENIFDSKFIDIWLCEINVMSNNIWDVKFVYLISDKNTKLIIVFNLITHDNLKRSNVKGKTKKKLFNLTIKIFDDYYLKNISKNNKKNSLSYQKKNFFSTIFIFHIK